MTLEEACEVGNQIKLNPRRTYIEPSRFSGYLFNNLSAATEFKMTFDAKRWPTKDDDLFFMYVERSPEVAAWVGSRAVEFERVEIVAVLFGSGEDRERFEQVLWPAR